MKKVIFISALAIAAAVSCTKSDIVDTKFDEQIGFQTYLGRAAQTKAAVIDKDNIDDFSIGLYGFYTGKDGYEQATSIANLWANEKLYWETSAWKYDNPKYWTNAEDKYTFLAYSPYVEISTTEAGVKSAVATYGTGEGAGSLTVNKLGEEADPTLTYVLPADQNDQIDLLYANDASHVGMTRPGEGATLESVGLIFKHALSRITVKASENVDAYEYTIKSIVLSGNFNTTGTLALASGNWSAVSSSNPTYTFFTGTEVLTSEATEYKTKGYLMPIPTVEGTPTKVTVTVTYSTKFGDVVSKDMTKKVEFTTTFVKGTAYAINLAFEENKENPITFTVEDVEDWGADNPVPADKPLNPETGTVVPQA